MNSTFKMIMLVAGCGLLAASLGCHKQTAKTTQAPVDPNVRPVVLVAAAAFPKEMVGVWENKEHGWILKFEEDGRLSKIRHTVGRMDVTAGKKAEFPLVRGGEGTMDPGPWQVEYNGLTGELIVEIILNGFSYSVDGHLITGSSRDLFTGTAPKAGENVWRAMWINFPNFVATTADKQYENYELPFDEGMEDQGIIEFEKISLNESN